MQCMTWFPFFRPTHNGRAWLHAKDSIPAIKIGKEREARGEPVWEEVFKKCLKMPKNPYLRLKTLYNYLCISKYLSAYNGYFNLWRYTQCTYTLYKYDTKTIEIRRIKNRLASIYIWLATHLQKFCTSDKMQNWSTSRVLDIKKCHVISYIRTIYVVCTIQ